MPVKKSKMMCRTDEQSAGRGKASDDGDAVGVDGRVEEGVGPLVEDVGDVEAPCGDAEVGLVVGGGDEGS